MLIRRRHVFYVAGNDPKGADNYYRLFCRELKRFQKVSGIAVEVSALDTVDAVPGGVAAGWSLVSRGENWQTSTTYEFLRWDDIISANMAAPMGRRYIRVAASFVRNLFNGLIWRIFRASWRYGIGYIYPMLGLLVTIAVPLVIGRLAYALAGLAGLSAVWSLAVSGVIAAASYWLALKQAKKAYVLQLGDARIWFDDWAYDRRPDYAERTDIFARRLIAKIRANDVDEVLIVGHSGGGATALLIVARALQLDPEFSRPARNVTLLTLGSLLPLLALYPRAQSIRDAIRRVAVEQSIAWVDCQARKDVMHFYGIDPVRDVGVKVDDDCRNPIVWRLSIRDLVNPEQYGRMRLSVWRMHFQYIMANDRPNPYDFFMFVCAPVPMLNWLERGEGALAEQLAAAGSVPPVGDTRERSVGTHPAMPVGGAGTSEKLLSRDVAL